MGNKGPRLCNQTQTPQLALLAGPQSRDTALSGGTSFLLTYYLTFHFLHSVFKEQNVNFDEIQPFDILSHKIFA